MYVNLMRILFHLYILIIFCLMNKTSLDKVYRQRFPIGSGLRTILWKYSEDEQDLASCLLGTLFVKKHVAVSLEPSTAVV